ncbi:MAG: hypothetical protein ACOY3E_14555 [Pseudomonadota bacterium]
MAVKEWLAEVDGHEIRLINTWTNGAYLYIDGLLRDTNHDLFAVRRSRLMSARMIRGDDSSPLVEVFVQALFTVKAQIKVNGRHVAGDRM